MEIVSLVIGAGGFALALVLGVIRLVDFYRDKPRLEFDSEWIYRPNEDPRNAWELRMYVSNLGRRSDSVRAIWLGADREADPRFRPGSIRDRLPIVLAPNVVEMFVLGVHPRHEKPDHQAFHHKFLRGEIGWACVEDAKRNEHWFQLPKAEPPGEVEL